MLSNKTDEMLIISNALHFNLKSYLSEVVYLEKHSASHLKYQLIFMLYIAKTKVQ